MKLLIFPGGGSPDDKRYAKVYGLLSVRAKDFGYSSVDISIRWPGQILKTGFAGDVLTFQGALDVAVAKLAETEQEGEPYDLLARSFGTCVALKAVTVINAVHIRRIVLWGAAPLWVFWELFVRDLNHYKSIAHEKGLLVDESFFSTLEPLESLLKQTTHKVIVASGTDDKYSTPAFLAYLYQDVKGRGKYIEFRPPVKGAPHEVDAELPIEVVEDYLNCVLS